MNMGCLRVALVRGVGGSPARCADGGQFVRQTLELWRLQRYGLSGPYTQVEVFGDALNGALEATEETP